MKTWTDVISVTAPMRYGFVDLSNELRAAVKDSGISEGFIVAFCEHTTCALVINEWESGLLNDIKKRVEALIPSNGYYAHDDLSIRNENLTAEERVNGPAHVAQVVLGGTSQVIPLSGNELCMGQWQRLYLLELDEPKPRSVRFHLYG